MLVVIVCGKYSVSGSWSVSLRGSASVICVGSGRMSWRSSCVFSDSDSGSYSCSGS